MAMTVSDIRRYTSAEIFGPTRLPVASNRQHVDGSTILHGHDFLEIALIVDGHGMYVTRHGEQQVSRGSVMVLRPGHWHGYESCVGLDCFNLFIGVEIIDPSLAWALDYPNLARVLVRGGTGAEPLSLEPTQQIAGWLTEMDALSHTASADIVRVGLLRCVLGVLSDLRFDLDDSIPTAISQPVRDAMRMMSAEIAAAWSVERLARSLNLSPSHLHRQFKRQIGTSPMAWLNELRAERAAALLLQTGASVSEVGASVGWTDPNYASRRFREMHGVTATRYRARFMEGGQAS